MFFQIIFVLTCPHLSHCGQQSAGHWTWPLGSWWRRWHCGARPSSSRRFLPSLSPGCHQECPPGQPPGHMTQERRRDDGNWDVLLITELARLLGTLLVPKASYDDKLFRPSHVAMMLSICFVCVFLFFFRIKEITELIHELYYCFSFCVQSVNGEMWAKFVCPLITITSKRQWHQLMVLHNAA